MSLHHAAGVDTLVALLRSTATARAAETAFIFVNGKGDEVQRMTFGELDGQARAIGAVLAARFHPGDRVILLCPPTLDFVVAFFGCLYAGVVAVPVYPATKQRDLPRLERVIANAGARGALSTRPLIMLSQSLLSTLAPDNPVASLEWLAIEDAPAAGAEAWSPPAITGESLAFLQYTSGSTGTPRGVMVTHQNLLHNERMIQQAFGHDTQNTIVVGWLPLYHDMGLIGNVLQPLYLGRPCILMSPLDFLQRPALWLETISRYRATTSGGPSFGYELCARRLSDEQRAGLDLSSWKVAYNGAEPVRAEVIDKFSKTFAPQGFRREAFYPCYGLAEATLLITGGAHAEEPVTITVTRSELESRVVVPCEAGEAGARPLVGCGHAWLEQKLLIVDPDSRLVCPADRVGEIWISGSSVAKGYWNDPERNAQAFQGYLADTNEGPFLRTGDLGFVRNGELFITGRLKDVVIIRGRNHYPEDIELTVERSNPFLRPGCGAAFSIDVEGTEQLVIVQEVTRDALKGTDLSVVVADVREAVTANHGLRPYAVSLVLPARIPKTSSGKIQRQACRAQYLAQSLELAETQSQRSHASAGHAGAELSKTSPGNSV